MARSFSLSSKNLHLRLSETLPDSFKILLQSTTTSFKATNKTQNELILEILSIFEYHYFLHRNSYEVETLKTRDVMEKIDSDISIYKTRHLLLRLEEQGYILGMLLRGTQGLSWKLSETQ